MAFLFVALVLIVRGSPVAFASSPRAEISWEIELEQALTTAGVGPGASQLSPALAADLESRLRRHGTSLETRGTPGASPGAAPRFIAQGKGTLSELRMVLFDDLRPLGGLTGGPADVTLSGEAASGEQVSIGLEANPSTGYGWDLRDFDQESLNLEGTAIAAATALIGAPQRQKIVVRALRGGSATFTFAYRRPWERALPATRRVRLSGARLADVAELSDPVPQAPAPPDRKLTAPRAEAPADLVALPASFDWRSSGKVTDVRDQGGCGSCWAFSTVGAFESALLVAGRPATDLSEQYLVSCATGWGFFGCLGGGFAHDYHISTIPPTQSAAGAVLEADFPYTGSQASCIGSLNHPERLISWRYIETDSTVPSVNAIKQAIYTYGSVAASMCAGSGFGAYQGGVFAVEEAESCGIGLINHAIVLVGWNDAEGTWILKNSWGTWWGESGYMRIAWNVSNVGYAANYAVFVPPNPPYDVIVESTDPAAGAQIAVSPVDGNGAGAGITPLTRTYPGAASVTFTASALAGASEFRSWSGCDTASGRDCTVTMNRPRSLMAHYSLPLAEAVDQQAWSFTTAGDTIWHGQSAEAYAGGDAARSGAIDDGRESSLQTTRYFANPGDLGFFWKVSSERDCDYLRFFIDEVLQASISGTVAWEQQQFDLGSGTHTLRWVYSKDSLYSELADAGWIDGVSFVESRPPYVLTVASTNPATGVVIAASPVDVNGAGGGATPFTRTYDGVAAVTLAAAATAGGKQFSSWSGCDAVAGTSCTVTVDRSRTVTANYLYSLAEAVDQPAWSFTTGGDTVWFGQTTTAHAGSDAAQSGVIGDRKRGTSTWMRAERTLAASGELSFWWKASGQTLDHLRIFIDGVERAQTNGTVAWEQKRFLLYSGTHTFMWVYSRDGLGTTDGVAWVDAVSLVEDLPPYVLTVASTNPESGAEIAVTPADGGGASNGTTPFTRSYDSVVQVTLVPAAGAGGMEFGFWSGCDSAVGRTCIVTMDRSRTVTANYAIPLAEAVDRTAWSFTTGGDGTWFGETSTSYAGGDAVQSGPLGDGKSTWLQSTREFAHAGTLTFWWKVSSELDYDYLRFFVDDVLQTSISGAVAWEQKQFNLGSGTHTLRWEYSKDPECCVEGSDAGWVDAVSFVPLMNVAPTFAKGADQTVLEHSGPQAVPGWATDISPGDPEEYEQQLDFILSNDNNGLFSAQPAISPSGTLTYASATSRSGIALVTARLHDNGGTANGGDDMSAPRTFTITVEDVVGPGVETFGIQNVSSSGATLTGEVNPRGTAATAWFEWGTDPVLASPTLTAPVDLGDGTEPVPVSSVLDNLGPGVTYYYRVVAQNAEGTARGAIDYFAPEQAENRSPVVNCTDDVEPAPPGKMTLREAVARAASPGTITFDPRLDGARIDLSIVGATDSFLKGEVFTKNTETGKWEFQGYQERNYGKSALYVDRSITIDASGLPHGITLAWAGGDASHARVLAVYGDLAMNNVTVSGGYAAAEPLRADEYPTQPYTLARGGGIAVWGTATLTDCTLAGNRAVGDSSGSRDRGTFGGGIYADTVNLTDCVVSGNSVTGYGGSGGGVFSVGGVESGLDSYLSRSAVTGNRVTAQHAYGGGVYSDGGGPGNMMTMNIQDCTIARNLVEDNPDIAENAMTQYYYRGGGFYMSNGILNLSSSTIVENAVTGVPAIFSGKPNMGGGGIGATIGNAHVVESMDIWHSVVAGNTLSGSPSDVFTGSLIDFYSSGYNLLGDINFSPMLVPVPSWLCLSRRHYPQAGDQDGISVGDVLDLGNVRRHDTIDSVGTDAGAKAVLSYPPRGIAVDRIPPDDYYIPRVWVGYDPIDKENPVDDFPSLVLDKIEADFGFDLRSGNEAMFEDLSAVVWFAEAYTWPSDPRNVPWVSFWRNVDAAIGDRLGTVGLGDDFWGTFEEGPYGDHLWMSVYKSEAGPTPRSGTDQLGNARFAVSWGDVGAVEITTETVAPAGSILINGGAAWTGTTAVTLNLSATDTGGSGLASMRFRNSTLDIYSAWEPYTSIRSWTLNGGTGTRRVYVQFVDRAGNISDANSVSAGAQGYVDEILLCDKTPPTGSILIDNGAASISTTAVTLNLAAADTGGSGLASMHFRNSTLEPYSAWEPYQATKPWTLKSGTGTRRVYAQFVDGAGNVSDANAVTTGAQGYADEIVLYDTTRPTGSILINSGAASTSTAAVTLTLAAADTGGSGLASMRLRNTTEEPYSAWEPYLDTRAWTLKSGTGTRRVYVQVMDGAGNVSDANPVTSGSQGYVDTIVLE